MVESSFLPDLLGHGAGVEVGEVLVVERHLPDLLGHGVGVVVLLVGTYLIS